MSVFLYRRLIEQGILERDVLLGALATAQTRQVSFVEALVQLDVSYARVISECVATDGEVADPSWRPDSRLLLDLPPGICERHLAFPFRERAGSVEIATVTPLDDWIGAEFSEHLGRPIELYRGSLQALLAAAGAVVDLKELSEHLSDPVSDKGAIPLVRKAERKERPRKRTRTSPGLGKSVTPTSHDPVIQNAPSIEPDVFRKVAMTTLESSQPSIVPSIRPQGTARPPTWVSPGTGGEQRVRDARDPRELAQAVGAILPAPSLVFELKEARLKLRSASGPGAYGETSISLVEESALATAVEEGNYLGGWYDCPIHLRFANSFQSGALVRVERIGTADRGLIVTMVGEFDASRAADILDLAGEAWSEVLKCQALDS